VSGRGSRRLNPIEVVEGLGIAATIGPVGSELRRLRSSAVPAHTQMSVAILHDPRNKAGGNESGLALAASSS
jgi:hypothetical protein